MPIYTKRLTPSRNGQLQISLDINFTYALIVLAVVLQPFKPLQRSGSYIFYETTYRGFLDADTKWLYMDIFRKTLLDEEG